MTTAARRSLVVAGLAVVLLGAGAWAWFTRAPAPVPVLLITIDTLRADALSALGGAAPTPEIDRLAAQGVLFGQAVTAVPLTGPSHASILGGQFPYRHGIRDNGQVLAPGQAGLAGWLRAAGFRTAAFVSGFPLHRQFGFDQGFDHYDDQFAAAPGGNPFALQERRAEDTVRAAQHWLQATTAPNWFVWVHLYDPHTPYSAPAAFAQDGPHGEYLAEVAYTDHWVGELVRAARQRHPDTIVVITSDHGEGLGEHGEYDHGLLLFQSTLRVPLLIDAPGSLPPQRLDTPVRTVDIAPTVLSLVGAPPTANLDGIDLAPALRQGHAPQPPPAYSESYFGAVTYGWAPLHALREGDWKRVQGARAELFDLRDTPLEATPRSDAAAAGPGARLESLLAQVPEPAPPAANDAISAAAIARLRSLGYLSAGAPLQPSRWRNDIDPRDGLAEHTDVLKAQEALDERRWADAEQRLRAILQQHPDNRVARLRLGSLLFGLRRAAEGIAELQRASDLDPDNPETRYQLADALLRSGQYSAAADAWAEVTRRQPRRSVAWSNLGSSLLLGGKPDAAIAAYEQAVELAPEAANLRENLARAQLRNGRTAAAIATLKQLEQVQKDTFVLAAVLAVQLADSGDRAAAEDWLARAKPGQEAYAEAHLSLALAWLAQDKPRAGEHLRQALAAKPALQQAVDADAELAAVLHATVPAH
ncbi:arylsulfatase A-like enzyme [Tahibacter aquaticus]|uniref:Arylsulfatase A-like enzyme n=1 Tax=Tahibacter aquaticus TaxID=520092 RepID=A0A4V3DMJ9_9GAMM|nr:sulfatase-like hydrolase/transferase [Tahibacter aquaticus]TDR44896.1 arylsulfatase A-like enzyme [Tahibacter aquaticus]